MTGGKRAVVFAGQGAQFVGMGRDLSESMPEVASLFSSANDILGYDLSGLCFNGPDSELVKSDNCQVAVFIVGVACLMALSVRSGIPCDDYWIEHLGREFAVAGSAGLSLGEWTALYVAGSVSFQDALRALYARGRFMQDACDEQDGVMLSVIGLGIEHLAPIAKKAGVEIANINSPEQIVLSGEREKMLAAKKLVEASGAKRAIPLNVAGAYHSSLMAPAAERLRDVLAKIDFRSPLVPVVSNVTGLPHEGPEDIRLNMALQVTSPVQWVATIKWFGNHGVDRYVECGPGRVLSGLAKRVHPESSVCNVQDAASLEKTLAVF